MCEKCEAGCERYLNAWKRPRTPGPPFGPPRTPDHGHGHAAWSLESPRPDGSWRWRQLSMF